ncbi:Uncharacterized protein APZ42_013286 [Daphnia magna]|uniref:Uncharacterized protein n=1 Tax=Daphnia magna TaxID=35525 RepID=A0A0P5BWY5_9CRUS|nr:Uncharacterized protein APZ42_013286 [Daphnia magna]
MKHSTFSGRKCHRTNNYLPLRQRFATMWELFDILCNCVQRLDVQQLFMNSPCTALVDFPPLAQWGSCH